MRRKSAVVVLHMGAAIAADATPPPNASTKIRKPNSWLTSLFLCLSQISLKSLGLSLSLSQMSLESLFIFSFRVCCWRKAFQDIVRKLPRFGSLFFRCWEVIDMNAAFCDPQMGLSRSGDDDDGGSAKICMLEVFFSDT
jgi:hypothetical protein